MFFSSQNQVGWRSGSKPWALPDDKAWHDHCLCPRLTLLDCEPSVYKVRPLLKPCTTSSVFTVGFLLDASGIVGLDRELPYVNAWEDNCLAMYEFLFYHNVTKLPRELWHKLSIWNLFTRSKASRVPVCHTYA